MPDVRKRRTIKTMQELVLEVERSVPKTVSFNIDVTLWRYSYGVGGTRKTIKWSIWHDGFDKHFEGRTPDEAYKSLVGEMNRRKSKPTHVEDEIVKVGVGVKV